MELIGGIEPNQPPVYKSDTLPNWAISAYLMVGREGIEPTRAFKHLIYSQAILLKCLPTHI